MTKDRAKYVQIHISVINLVILRRTEIVIYRSVGIV